MEHRYACRFRGLGSSALSALQCTVTRSLPGLLPQITQSLVEALRQFFIMFPGQRRRDLYIAGESFGGKMATALAHALLSASDSPAPNLKGLLVVNGLVEAESQLDKSDIAYQLGLVDEAGRDEMRALANEQLRLVPLIIIPRVFAFVAHVFLYAYLSPSPPCKNDGKCKYVK